MRTEPGELTALDEPYYCSQQIQIPPEFPDILKQYTKAAVRTQPKDALAWSAAYFRALANGDIPPIKDRVELPMATQKTDTGLTPGLLKTLNNQMATKRIVALPMILDRWQSLSLPKEQFDEIVRIGGFSQREIKWIHFLAVACTFLGESIADALEHCCKILTHDAEGGGARIPYPLFKELYVYLANVDGEISETNIAAVYAHLEWHVERQEGYVKPANFLTGDCPPLKP